MKRALSNGATPSKMALPLTTRSAPRVATWLDVRFGDAPVDLEEYLPVADHLAGGG